MNTYLDVIRPFRCFQAPYELDHFRPRLGTRRLVRGFVGDISRQKTGRQFRKQIPDGMASFGVLQDLVLDPTGPSRKAQAKARPRDIRHAEIRICRTGAGAAARLALGI
jgi:hypothetical protein